MDYRALIKSTAAARLLEADVRFGTAAHAYLLVGEDRTALDTLVNMFVADLVGGNYERVCSRNFADIITLPRGDKMLVSDVDFIIDTAYFTPTELPYKIYYIHSGESMSEICQNKLLKTLEEPPGHCMIIISSDSERNILNTVRSRCRMVKLEPLDDRAIIDIIDRHYSDNPMASLAKAASGGSLSRMESILNGGEYAHAFALALEMLTRMRRSSEILPYASKMLNEKDNIRACIDMIELILHDCMICSVGRLDLVRLKSNTADIRELSTSYNAEVVLRLKPLIVKAKQRIAANNNVASIVDELLFGLLEVKAKCH